MIKSVVVLGGGSAGWLTASLIAAKHHDKHSPFQVTLIESPNIPTIGVGEGTWPTMVNTLQQLGISELTFLQRCDASFKQASKFVHWHTGEKDDCYYHPFTPPESFEELSLVEQWQQSEKNEKFADAVSIQAKLCDENRAPKQLKLGDYKTIENYGYHLDAGKFAQLLTEHGVNKLGIKHIVDDVIKVQSLDNGDIAALVTQNHGEIAGDLFIDCSGQAAVLIGQHYKIPFISKKDVLFIDKAIATQVPYKEENDPVASATISTAQRAGWIWDIGLPSRRGVGHVFSSQYTSEAQAKADLITYLEQSIESPEQLTFKYLDINPGYRETFWHKNCVAVGMASGFLEPLEASALVMVELAAKTIALHMPAQRCVMDIVAKRYNTIMTFRWQRIIDFLKLHYVLSERDDNEFWRANRSTETIPDSLSELLELWQCQPPENNGFLSPYDLFPAASYQYILYGMGFKTKTNYLSCTQQKQSAAQNALNKVCARKQKVLPLLPTNRAILNEICTQERSFTLDVSADQSSHWQLLTNMKIEHICQELPVFFKRQKNNSFVPIALSHLTYKTLTDKPKSKAILTNELATYHNKETLAVEKLESLLEPAKLDITLNDNSNIAVLGLYVVNQKQWQQHDVKACFTAQQQQLIDQIIASISHVPKLIDRENLVRQK